MLLAELLRLGRKGVDQAIQRSRGDEPGGVVGYHHGSDRRTLLKVTMEAASEVDRLFTVLMGEEVEGDALTSRTMLWM